MPPRIPLFPCLKAHNVTPSLPSSRPFSSTPPINASTVAQRRKYRDPYAIAQSKARRAANISRQEVLKKERTAALGDPVRGQPTPYLQSFDTAQPTTAQEKAQDSTLNFFLHKADVDTGLQYSNFLSTPSSADSAAAQPFAQLDLSDDLTPEERIAQRQKEHDTAAEALRRITSLSLGSAKDRLRVNVQRCIGTFGRHTTDSSLPPRPASSQHNPSPPEKTPRVGPDTGSSEVQIAILTAKIKSLADFLESPRGRMDKANKRNLRLLVHRRAKLLKYLRRKERGGPRWQHLVQTLGLTEGTWRGEITIMGPLGGHSPVRLQKLLAREEEK